MAADAGIRRLFQRARQGDAQALGICRRPRERLRLMVRLRMTALQGRIDPSDVVQTRTWRRPALPEYARESRCRFFSGCDS